MRSVLQEAPPMFVAALFTIAGHGSDPVWVCKYMEVQGAWPRCEGEGRERWTAWSQREGFGSSACTRRF